MPRSNQTRLALLLLAGALGATPAKAAVLFTNFSASAPLYDNSNGMLITSSNGIAASFQISNTAVFTGADLALRTITTASGSINIYLAANNGTAPGALLEQLVEQSPVLSFDTIIGFSSTSTPTLTPGTYWIVASYPGSSAPSLAWEWNNTGALGGRVTFSNSSPNGPWSPFPQATPAFRVNGDLASAAPEPATLALLGLGVVGIGLAKRRRSMSR